MTTSRRPVLVVAALGAALTVAAWSALPAGAADGPVEVARHLRRTAGRHHGVHVRRDAGARRRPRRGPRRADRQPQDGPHAARVGTAARTRRTARTPTTWPCGATGAAAGAHYQNAQDPAVGGSETTASANPSYANPGNEVWLDLVTNDDGNGRAQTVVDWPFRPTATGAPRLGDPAPQHHQHRWRGAAGQRRRPAGLRHGSVLNGVQATASTTTMGDVVTSARHGRAGRRRPAARNRRRRPDRVRDAVRPARTVAGRPAHPALQRPGARRRGGAGHLRGGLARRSQVGRAAGRWRPGSGGSGSAA